MAKDLSFNQSLDKESLYPMVLKEVRSVLADEVDLIANMANIAAILKEAFAFLWVGFYIKRDNELVLGPFQGPLACTRIAFHRGVCGKCYTDKKTIIVDDVNAFPGHIACSSKSQSEIVVPVFSQEGEVIAVLDVDSESLSNFSDVDQFYLEEIAKILTAIKST